MSAHWKFVAVGLFVVFLTGCQFLPERADKQEQADQAAQHKEQTERAAQKKKQAERAAQRKKQADIAARKKNQAKIAAQQEEQAKIAAEQEEQAAIAAQQEEQAEIAAQQEAQAEREAQQQQCLVSVKQLRDISARWKDAERLTASSPRIALPKRLANLRKIRQELENSPVPRCSDKARSDLATSMDITVNFFLKFMYDDREYQATELAKTSEGKSDRQIAKRLMDSAEAELTRIESCKGACMEEE